MEDGVWDCSVCTFKNSAEAFKCAMCDVRKGTSTRKPKPNPQLVAQQVAQQMVTVPKKQSLKRVAERVDLGSDTSQDSHRSETRDGEPSFSKASSLVLPMNSQLPQQQADRASPPVLAASLTSCCEASGPPDNRVRADVSSLGSHIDASAGQRHCQFPEPHNKSFSSIRQGHTTSSNGNSFAYPFFMDITVNGLTVRIEERDPKNASSRQANAQKVKRRKTTSNSHGTNIGLTNGDPSPLTAGRTSDCSSLNSSSISDQNGERKTECLVEEMGPSQPQNQVVPSSGESNTASVPTLQGPPCTPSPVPPQVQRMGEVSHEARN